MKKEFVVSLLILSIIFSSGQSYNKKRDYDSKLLNILLELCNDIDLDDYDNEAPVNKKMSKNL
jgi:hypothetical protein